MNARIRKMAKGGSHYPWARFDIVANAVIVKFRITANAK